jgi:hypothetical protein
MVRAAVGWALRTDRLGRRCGRVCHGNGGTGISAIPPATGHIDDWVLTTNAGPAANLITYQPAGRFWAFQSIEAGIFVTLGPPRSALRSGCCTDAPCRFSRHNLAPRGTETLLGARAAASRRRAGRDWPGGGCWSGWPSRWRCWR